MLHEARGDLNSDRAHFYNILIVLILIPRDGRGLCGRIGRGGIEISEPGRGGLLSLSREAGRR